WWRQRQQQPLDHPGDDPCHPATESLLPPAPTTPAPEATLERPASGGATTGATHTQPGCGPATREGLGTAGGCPMSAAEILTRSPVLPTGDPPPQGPATPTAQLPPGVGKIRPSHLERLAVVYVRQSTPQQVAGNRESTELQYALAQRAVTLGWPQERILIIDEDQGRSAESEAGRLGFQRLLAEV